MYFAFSCIKTLASGRGSDPMARITAAGTVRARGPEEPESEWEREWHAKHRSNTVAVLFNLAGLHSINF